MYNIIPVYIAELADDTHTVSLIINVKIEANSEISSKRKSKSQKLFTQAYMFKYLLYCTDIIIINGYVLSIN